jgi:hypothetical protein
MGAEPLRVVEGGRAPRGWEALWRRDVWCQSELPHGDLVSTYRGEEFLHFERIGQAWLKEAAKHWARTRRLADGAADDEQLSRRDRAFQRVARAACAGGERAVRALALGA